MIVLTTPEGRKRRVVRPPGAPAMPDAPENALEDFAGCPSDGCSISSAAPDATRAPTSRGARSDVASTDAARARQREQLESMKVAAAPDVRRKRRVLKRLRLEPDAAPVAFDVIEIEEGNCPSDGCSIEAASPATCDEVSDSACDIDGLAARARRGYHSEKHSTEDARERVAFQVAAMRAATEELSRLAAAAPQDVRDSEEKNGMFQIFTDDVRGVASRGGACGEIRLIAQIHDELLFEMDDDARRVEAAARAVRRCMEAAAPELTVPTPTKVSVGANWRDLRPLREWLAENKGCGEYEECRT